MCVNFFPSRKICNRNLGVHLHYTVYIERELGIYICMIFFRKYIILLPYEHEGKYIRLYVHLFYIIFICQQMCVEFLI